MKPLNHKERSNSIIKFSILFIVALAIACAALFISYSIPYKLSEKQYAQLKDLQKYYKYEQQFIELLIKSDELINDISASPKEADVLKIQVAKDIQFGNQLKVKGTFMENIRIVETLENVYLNYLNLAIKNKNKIKENEADRESFKLEMKKQQNKCDEEMNDLKRKCDCS